MTNLNNKNYVGIDVSKLTLDVCVLPSEIYYQYNNNKAGFKALTKLLSTLNQPAIVFEATGGYERPLAKYLALHNLLFSIVNPRYVRDFAKSMGRLAKTDKVDSKIIAMYADKMQPSHSIMRDAANEKLNELRARREQLVGMIVAEKNRLEKEPSSFIKKSINQIIKVLQKELAKIEAQINDAIQADENLSAIKTILCSFKGIGTATATALLSCLPELGKLSAKKIAALVGLAPLNCDSGKFRGVRTTWGGRASVRTALYMATLVAIRHNPQIKQFYDRLVNSGKKKKVGVIAAMHKMLTIINAMVKNKQVWAYETAQESSSAS